ncbi:MAG: hypothetical protein NTX03_06105, partial [Bacteroidetes bacterium]|nr:hypothetical protein [Bacteroidota bacterium]
MKLSGSYCKQDPSILFYGTDSPDLFSKAITNLRFGTTNKTTKPGRHQLCNKLMLSNIDFTNKTILDVGASDGSTSFDLINLLSNKFNNYFVTDYNLF